MTDRKFEQFLSYIERTMNRIKSDNIGWFGVEIPRRWEDRLLEHGYVVSRSPLGITIYRLPNMPEVIRSKDDLMRAIIREMLIKYHHRPDEMWIKYDVEDVGKGRVKVRAWVRDVYTGGERYTVTFKARVNEQLKNKLMGGRRK